MTRKLILFTIFSCVGRNVGLRVGLFEGDEVGDTDG